MAKTPATVHLKCGCCNQWYDYPKGQFPNTCPLCGKQTVSMTCNRCGHSWELRRRQFPKVCPNCKTPYYSTLKFKFRS